MYQKADKEKARNLGPTRSAVTMDDMEPGLVIRTLCISLKKLILIFGCAGSLVALCRLSLAGTILYCDVSEGFSLR